MTNELKQKEIEMKTRKEIIEMASDLEHDFIIIDAVNNTEEWDEEVVEIFMQAIEKITEIEANYTEEEVFDGNLLCDIF
jgi:thymidylate kinase